MLKVMDKLIKTSIVKRINEKFTSPIIYIEQTVQKFKKPCFFIWTVSTEQTKLMQDTFTRDYVMNIRFHPEDNQKRLNEELISIGEILLESLIDIELPIFITKSSDGEYVAEELPVWGTKPEYKIQDEILQMFITYKVRLKRIRNPIPVMEQEKLNIDNIE